MLRGLKTHSDQLKWDVSRLQSKVVEPEDLTALRAEVSDGEDGRPTSKVKASPIGLDIQDEEIARLRFRCASLSKQLKIGDSALVHARGETARTEAEIARLHQELALAYSALDEAKAEAARTEREVADLREDVREWKAKVARSETARTVECAELHRRARKVRLGTRLRLSFPFSREGRAYRRIAASGLFDEAWYLNEYKDVAASGIDPLIHFLRAGASEGRNPSPFFSTSLYCQANPDVVAARINPLLHYVLHGQNEGRAPNVMCLAAGASA